MQVVRERWGSTLILYAEEGEYKLWSDQAYPNDQRCTAKVLKEDMSMYWTVEMCHGQNRKVHSSAYTCIPVVWISKECNEVWRIYLVDWHWIGDLIKVEEQISTLQGV
jgi:hypothetical protein